ncbi:hypothetical protein ACGF8B_28805 [Streptomyces sp. NPDC047917]|uniref:hypothetical protein n=1 Tax=Streptomyces sp. NPDC047917 TaxID=3365491 RepID=UPI003720202D
MDFFTLGTTYAWRPDRYKAPEQWRYFKCTAISEFPGPKARIAFGFITAGMPSDRWTPTGLDQDDWADGWFALPDDSQK